VLIVPDCSVAKLVVLELVSSFKLDVSPKFEGVASDEDPKPSAVAVDDELTPREDVPVLPKFSVTKFEVLELVSSFKLELTPF